MRRLFLFILSALLSTVASATGARQNRGLIAFVNGNFVQVEWRMRATDDPTQTQYKLYADGELYGTFRSKTTARLAKARYQGSTFALVVEDKDGKEIDRQENVAVWATPCLDIPLQAPAVRSATADTVIVGYSPLDASAYDMDGDGEQEILLKWDVSYQGKDAKASDRHEFVDCYKLDGTRLWRIDFGQNSVCGNNFTFMVWDFDGDGKGEMIAKTAPGTKDGLGNYVGKGLAGYPGDLEKAYYRGSDGLPTDGEEWVTCFDGVTGRELASRQYWPYFGIQSNWNPGGNADGKTYGRRGNGFKGAVITIPCRDGQTRPVCYMQRGIYTYVYATAISWDGTSLTEEWRHSSTGDKSATTENAAGKHTQGISLYAQGAHSGEAGDIDGDGYDEVCIGAAAIDHDGTVLWSTGLGHGDAIGVGEFNPANEGLETWRITEAASGYSSTMHDGKTGAMLNGQAYSGGDVNRGVIMDLDSTRAGFEYWHNASGSVYDCNGNALYEYNRGNATGYPNFRIFWDDDLLDEHFDGNGVAKFDTESHNWLRATLGRGDNTLLWKQYNVLNINSTKCNANLVCDLVGDFREELVMYTTAYYANRTDCDYVLRVITTTYDTGRKLPWLRDDHTYDIQIASQNVGYSMPPHLGYNAFEWYKSLGEMGKDEIFDNAQKVYFYPQRGAYNRLALNDDHDTNLNFTSISNGFASCNSTPYEVQFVYVTDTTYYIKGSDGKYLKSNGKYGFAATASASDATPFIGFADHSLVIFKSTQDPRGNGNVWVSYDTKRKACSRGNSEKGAYAFYVAPTGNTDPTAIERIQAGAASAAGGPWYNAAGARTGKPAKGVSIRKGKKVIVRE